MPEMAYVAPLLAEIGKLAVWGSLKREKKVKFFIGLHFISGVMVPFLTEWGGINFTQIMVLQSWYMFWIFVFGIPTGAIADFLGRRASLILACFVNIVAFLIYASTPNFYVFLLGEFIWALSAALLAGASDAFVYDTLRMIDESGKSKNIFGRIESLGLAGMMIGAPIGSLIASHFSLRAPMLLSAIPFAAALLVAMTFKEPRATKNGLKTRYVDVLKKGMKFFYEHRVLKILALDMILIASVAYFMIWLYQPMLKQAGVGIAYFGVIYAAFVGIEMLIMNNYEKLEELLGSKKRLIFVSSVITGLMFIIGGLTNFIPVVSLAIIVGGGVGLSRGPLFISYMNKYVPSSKRATVLSTVSMLKSLALVVANPVVGLLVDWSLKNTLMLLGTMALVFSFVSKVEENHLVD